MPSEIEKEIELLGFLSVESNIHVSSKDFFCKPVLSDIKVKTVLTTKMNTVTNNYFCCESVQSQVSFRLSN